MCLSVWLSVPPFFDTTVGLQPNLARICGLIWEWLNLNTFAPSHPRRGSQGGFMESTSQGNVTNCPYIHSGLLTPTPPWGGEFLGSTFQKFGKFHELPRKSIHCVTLTPTQPGGGLLGDTISASSFEKYIGNAIILSDYIGNIPGGVMESEGGIRVGGREGEGGMGGGRGGGGREEWGKKDVGREWWRGRGREGWMEDREGGREGGREWGREVGR